MANHVVAVTGASGAIYAVRLLQVLLSSGDTVHLSISRSGVQVLRTELGLVVDLNRFHPRQIFPSLDDTPIDGPARLDFYGGFRSLQNPMNLDRLHYHRFDDFSAGIASGSFLTRGMVICPCSMGTLASLAGGHSENLIQRAADVHLKERRKLIVVPRETPISPIQLDNMRRLADAGAVVLPAMPGFYHGAKSIPDLVDFVVARIADQLGVSHQLMQRWGDEASA
ncbi:MAG TPA: 3-octaprenyl-4-hydroxybenzoate carboxy-lyase [Planctomycetaceae bacterium]|nr:3-octaprenyl-4-hydroxybenzoate carboxy-lyase [Planctomycetaceae bacterium]